MVACALLRNVYPLRNGWSRNGWSQVLLSNKETLFSKRNFPAINYNNLQGKNVFEEQLLVFVYSYLLL